MLELLRQQLAGDAAAADEPPGGLAGLTGSAPQIAQLLSQREAQLQRDLAAAEEAERLEAQAELRLAERHEREESLRRRVDELTDQLDAAYGLLDDLAAALGACPACFGGDDACRWCRGRGAPGFTAPEPSLFNRLVRPAVVLFARLHRRVAPTVTTGPPSQRERTQQ